MRDISYYLDYLPEPLLDALWEASEPVVGVEGLRVEAGLRAEFPAIETAEALQFVVDLYDDVREHLQSVLQQRAIDRGFMDEVTKVLVEHNESLPFDSPDYETVLGAMDEDGRIVIGPLDAEPPCHPVKIPDFLEGEQVTLFGPPDTAKLSINAMNAIHRVPAGEPEIVADLVEKSGQVARWGADNEDSKTPIMRNFLLACQNLIGCFDESIRFEDEQRGKVYELADDRLSVPIKRIPGLALPDGNHLLNANPLPLHLVDFGLHMFHNRTRRKALVFYVPKLENEEEAAYLKALIHAAETRLKAMDPSYEMGTVQLFIVFENPRAIFRIRKMAATLAPYFLGGSLGWHDFLGSTARLFRYDPRYRIPVKADPNIVINHIRQSHRILVDALDSCGGIKIGGMYGVLYEDGNRKSFEVSIVGYVKDVVTQLKRGLDGFWVAHPDFVRTGIALVQAFRDWETGDDTNLRALIAALVPNETERTPLLGFVFGPDVDGLDPSDPLYERSVLAATLETSDVIANHDPAEVRYNVFQALQYLADWLSGNGCVALPAKMKNAAGEDVFVRVMDDLATTERSRWEVWAEVFHGRVSQELFAQILADEVEFLRNGEDAEHKRIQVRWEGEAARWYPIAVELLRELMTSPHPPEFATELLMPFTLDLIRDADDPWAEAHRLCPGKYPN